MDEYGPTFERFVEEGDNDEARWVERRAQFLHTLDPLLPPVNWRETHAEALALSELGYSASGIATQMDTSTGTARDYLDHITLAMGDRPLVDAPPVPRLEEPPARGYYGEPPTDDEPEDPIEVPEGGEYEHDTPSDPCPERRGEDDETHQPGEPRMMSFPEGRAFGATCEDCGRVLAAEGTWF